jgi:hypothetical protein
LSTRSRTLRALKVELLTLVGCFLGLVLVDLLDEPMRASGWQAVGITLALLFTLGITICFVFAVVDGLKVVLKGRRERSRD